MKLYTEEQVIELMYWISPVYMDREDIKIFLENKSEPIEIPSDEEIEKIAEIYFENDKIRKIIWINGVKYFKEQIFNQNK